MNTDSVSFLTRFDTETVLVGYPEAHLYVEACGADDMDLFVLIQKIDAHGTPLQAFTVPNQSARAHDLTDQGATTVRYKGSDGRLRVSARHLDEALTTDDVPAHSFDRVEKLAPGSRNLLGTLMPGIREYVGASTGGQYASYLQLPVQARS